MKLIKNILLITAMSMFLFSCTDEKQLEPVDNSKIELSEQAIVATPQGGEFSITVTSSEDWRVSGFCDWVTVANESGTNGSALKLTVAPNEGVDAKTAEFKVFAGSATATLSITSTPDMYMELAKDEAIKVASKEGSFTIGLKTNCPDIIIDYTDGAETWLENTDVIPGFAGKQMFEFKVAKTDKFKARNGKIAFKMKDSDKVVYVDVEQAQLDTAIVVEGPKIVKGIEAVDFEMHVKSNVDFNYRFPSWIEEVEKTTGEKDETGLATTTFKLHCDATGGSRGRIIEFRYLTSDYDDIFLGKVLIKQQNPHPVFCTIPDPVLRNVLIEQDWVLLEDEATGKCEIIAMGMEGTQLTLSARSMWDELDIKTLDGLEQFPKLTKLSMVNCTFVDLDLSKLTNITSVHLKNVGKLATCTLGSIPVKELSIINDEYGFQSSKTIVVSGENVETLDIHAYSYYIRYYEKLETLDVTGLPKLKTLKAKRGIPNWRGDINPSDFFKTILMTADQEKTVTVDKFDTVSIVVK